jgi:serine/threonine protein kinase
MSTPEDGFGLKIRDKSAENGFRNQPITPNKKVKVSMHRFKEIYSPMANMITIQNHNIVNTPTKTVNKFETQFEVIEVLGSGSFGEAFKVKSKMDGRLYAIKKTKQKYQGMGDRNRKLEEVKKAI